MPAARLLWPVPVERPRAVVLVLHGGKARSQQPVSRWQPAVWRMRPFELAVAEAGRREVAVAALRYAVRGWNGSAASPLADARLALDQLSSRHPGVPIGLLGHSMGGRVALHLGDDARVRAIAALAPWVESGDRPVSHDGLHLLVMHGTRDRMTSPRSSQRYAAALAARGVDVTFKPVDGEGHAMLREAGRWHEESARFLAGHLLPEGPARGTGRGAT
ncbi:alpha/beta hydrolase family protein [Pedococcus sp. 5OH_020]|uniref:alpha/beta hydrolase family protein n=1 Tax=Pedococcus sp. 5OH_020 TaxID=2989814 RepID=UPI0022E9CCD4|nr:alpha/beta hydrolase [Pedococcus sp. 5OH_020]